MDYRGWAILACAIAAPLADLSCQTPIDTLALKAHTYFLAHDRLAGRATGSDGAALAALYLASQCRALSLLPADSEYAQSVALEEATVGPGTTATVSLPDGPLAFRYPSDFTPSVGTRATLVNFGGPAVYVGAADQLDSLAFEELQLQGSVALVLGPRVSVESMVVLRSRGVVGVILLAPDSSTYSLYQRSRGRARLYHADETVRSSFIPPLPTVIAGPRMSYAAMRGTPLDRDGQPVPGPLTSTVSVELDLDRRSIRADNVVCVLPGTDASAADTAIALSAHYDHLGVVPGVPSGDSIYNGFSDNAAGVAALLAIAKALTSESAPPVRNSILFLFFVGEERGLLGSDFYAAHPTWPLTKIKALINIDAGAPPGRPGWRVVTSPPRANSDYYPFVREGVPGVFIVPGPDPYEGLSADSSTALRKRWDFYHHPSDEWSEAFPFVGLQRYAEYAYLLARALDRTPRSSLNR